ncbi:MAG: hypothetical protein JWR16_2240 [Nevskia sp.]|nr:hypothetical protein [Nevskia sp.]
MQLNDAKPQNLARMRLVAATLGLLGVTTVRPVAADDDTRKWTFDNGLLFYKENGGRVQAIEPVVNAAVDLGNDRTLSMGLVLDSLTGATPSGAAPAVTPQTFSSPSGRGKTYTIAPGATPLDNTFKDTRFAATLGYLFPLNNLSKLGVGLSGSKEYDFTSVGANTHYSLDLNQKNTTLNAGLSFEYDQVDPVGHVPIPLTMMVDAVKTGGTTKTKNVKDVLLGVTQIIDPQSLLQFNYSLSLSNGYETDPYKILSVVDSNAQPQYYVYEKRPDSRTKHALFAEYKRFVFGHDVADLSYRFFIDSWGVRAHTVDLSYRWNFSQRQYLEPNARFYTQTAADFFHAALFTGEDASVSNASADPRLGAFNAWTGGLKYGQVLGNGNELSVRVEYYKQFSKVAGVPDQAATALSQFNLAPNLSAFNVSLGYRFNW